MTFLYQVVSEESTLKYIHNPCPLPNHPSFVCACPHPIRTAAALVHSRDEKRSSQIVCRL